MKTQGARSKTTKNSKLAQQSIKPRAWALVSARPGPTAWVTHTCQAVPAPQPWGCSVKERHDYSPVLALIRAFNFSVFPQGDGFPGGNQNLREWKYQTTPGKPLTVSWPTFPSIQKRLTQRSGSSMML